MRVAIVHQHRQAEARGKRQLPGERLALDVRRREVAEEVQADLADGTHAGLPGEGLEPGPGGLVHRRRVVRMHADRRVNDLGMAGGQLECRLG